MKYIFLLLLFALTVSACTKYDVGRDNPKDLKNPNYVPPPPPPKPKLVCTRYTINSTASAYNKLVAGDDVKLRIYVKNTGNATSEVIECVNIKTVESSYKVIYEDYNSGADMYDLNAGDSSSFLASIKLQNVPVSGLLPVVITLGDNGGHYWNDTLNLLIEKVNYKLTVSMPGPFYAYDCYYSNYDIRITNTGSERFKFDELTVTPTDNGQYVKNVDLTIPAKYIDPNITRVFTVTVDMNCGIPQGESIPFDIEITDVFGNTKKIGAFTLLIVN